MFNPSQIMSMWKSMENKPMGKRLFSKALGQGAPYSGTISATVLEVSPGHSKIQIKQHRTITNHLNSIHAIALMNLGEMCTGLAMLAGLGETGRGIIINLSMDYVKKARGTITGEVNVQVPTEPGDHDFNMQADLTDESGDTVATAHAVWRLEVFDK